MLKNLFLSASVLALFAAVPAYANPLKTYPLSGTAVEVDSQYIVVEGDGKKLQMVRDATTQFSGDLKQGDKVQVEYVLVAKDVKVTSAAKKPEVVPVTEAPKAETPKVEPHKPEPVKTQVPKTEESAKPATEPAKQKEGGGLLDGFFKK